MNVFNGLNIYNLNTCPNDTIVGGLALKLYYAPSSFFKRIDLPSETGDYTHTLLINQTYIQFQNDEIGWASIDILVDENELKNSINGGLQRKKVKTNLDVFILGYKPQVLGFIQKMQNQPMVFCIAGNNGGSMLIGNLRNRAFIEAANGSTGKVYEDNAGVQVSITCNAPTYFFEENIVINPEDNSDPGIVEGNRNGGFIDITQDY